MSLMMKEKKKFDFVHMPSKIPLQLVCVLTRKPNRKPVVIPEEH